MPEPTIISDHQEFAEKFLRSRVQGYQKDFDICLTPTHTASKQGPTHAYFPAFMISMALLDFAACLYCGNLKPDKRNPANKSHIDGYCARFAPAFDCAEFRVLFRGFRHKVAHTSHPYIVYRVEPSNGGGAYVGALVAWRFDEYDEMPALTISAHERRQITSHFTPWDVYYDHTLQVHLPALSRLVVDSILTGPASYLAALLSEPDLLEGFMRCMEDYYPKMTP